ncbi:MAG: leucine-rich repeat protein [Lachnospiraceae bacterium]
MQIRADTAYAATNYLVLDRACKNGGSVTIPYLNKSSSLFVFCILRDGEWKQVYCADLGKSAASYTAMTKDNSILSAISDNKKQLLSYVPAFGLGSLEFPISTIQDPRGMNNLQKTYGILMQGYIWSVLKGIISLDSDGSLVGISKLKSVLKKINQYTYSPERGEVFIERFLSCLDARVKGTDDYSQVGQLPNLFFKTKSLANQNTYEMQRKEDGSLEYVYTDKKNILAKGEIIVNHSFLSWRREGNNYIFTVDAKNVDEFLKDCDSSSEKPGVCFTRTVKATKLKTLEGWVASNKDKSYQNLLYFEGEKITKTGKSYLAFDVADEELIPITVYKKDGSNKSIFISGAEFALQRYSDAQQKYETIMNFDEVQTGVHFLNISKKILLDNSDNKKLKFRIKEIYIPDGYSGKSAFGKVITGTELANGNLSFTAYNYRRKIKLAIRKVDEYLLDYKIAQFLSAKAEMQFPYQDPSVYDLTYQGTDEMGEPIYCSEYDLFVAKVLGEQYTDENGIFEQDSYTNELGRTLILSYLAKLSARFDIYEYSKNLGQYKTEPIASIETREGLGQEITTDFLMETEDNGGKLMICETKYPKGYESGLENIFYIEMNDGNDGKTVTLSNDSTGEFITNKVGLYRIIVQKIVKPLYIPSASENIVLKNLSPKDASFAVYAEENIGQIGEKEYLYRKNDLVCTVQIKEEGVGMTPYLYPGRYKMIEIKAPKDCHIEETEKVVAISDGDVHIVFENNPITEEIRIRKKDGEKDSYIRGAIIGLYANQDFIVDNTVVVKENTLLVQKEITEDETIFSNLPFGKYYVKELEAPAGYQCSEVKLEFDIPSTPPKKENVVLYGTLSNFYKPKRKLIVRKEIDKKDIYWKHGNPTFLFRVRGEDYSGVEHIFERSIVFTKGDIKEGEDFVKKEIVFDNLIPGTYEAEELLVARYRLKEIKDIVNGSLKGKKAKFDLDKNEFGEVTFVNEKYEWQGFGHNDIAVNTFYSTNEGKKEVYLKGLAVTCSDFMSTENLDLSKFKVYAQYADGTAKQIDIAKCQVKPNKVNMIDNVFTNIIISYEEEGITVKTDIPVLYYERDNTSNLYNTISLKDGTVSVIGYNGTDTEIEIPAMIDGKIVSRVGRNYVSGKDIYVIEGQVDEETAQKNIQYYRISGTEDVTKIIFPNTVKTIGYAAFYKNQNLREVELNQVQIIKGQAFSKTGLSGELIIPDDVINIGGSAFRETKIESLRLSSSLQAMGSKIFYGCKNLTGILRIPILLGKIQRETFRDCNFTQLVFEGELSVIEANVFRGNAKLSVIEFINCGITKIESKAFDLESIAIMDTYIRGANSIVKQYPWELGGRNPVFE